MVEGDESTGNDITKSVGKVRSSEIMLEISRGFTSLGTFETRDRLSI